MLTEPGKPLLQLRKAISIRQERACIRRKKSEKLMITYQFSDFCFIRISSRFHEEKESGSEIAPVGRPAYQKKGPAWTAEKRSRSFR